MKTYIGIDNGVTGAIAALHSDDTWTLHPVRSIKINRGRLLDVRANYELLSGIATSSGGQQNIVIVYEQEQKNPQFGVYNYYNGRNGEFWRVLLTAAGLPFSWVNPRTWHAQILGITRGQDTKEMARVYVEQRFPHIDLSGQFNKEQQGGLTDAMCIALWARQARK